MTNEVVLLLTALCDITFIYIAAYCGRRWLVSSIVVNLLLVGVFGAKLVLVFGFITNAGNVFYACVFLATYFLIEQYGKEVARNTLFLGAASSIAFTVLAQFTLHLSGTVQNEPVSAALTTLFSFAPRIFLASMLAYVFAQYINIEVYDWLRRRTAGKMILLRSVGASAVSQLFDSSLFFSIAFFDLSGSDLLQAIFAGWCIKVLVVIAGSPLLYLLRWSR